MSAPISSKAVAGGVGALTGGGTTIAIVELLGQIPGLENANQNVVRALGSIIVVLGAMFGARWAAWAKKESAEFIAYAAKESGQLVVSAGTAAGVSPGRLQVIEQKIDALGVQLDSKLQADAEKLLSRYFPQPNPNLVTVTQLDTTAAAETPPAAPTAPVAAADPVLTDTHTTTVTDPVLTDDYTPPADTGADPVLAD